MNSTEPKAREVLLPEFKCVDQQVPSGPKITTHSSGPMGNVPLDNQPTFEFRRPEAYEWMASDKLGEELDPGATIWKLYLDEASEHDKELVDGRQKSLDTLLLFAALFSAILTAFLIESKSLLQLDPQDASVALLLFIAQSQRRVELGLPISLDQDFIPIVTDFQPSTLSRWVNGMWFISLALSLCAALIAMLGKEWLTAFLASRPRPPHAHAVLRQSRLEGLDRWWALHIIALLPSLLHLSLLLFSVGLVTYLWTLDTVTAIIIAVIVGTTTLFYIVTALLGAIYEFCPFVTEISEYMRRATIVVFGHGRQQGRSDPKEPTQKDIRALLWLANNARDPAVVDCSYQSLAGLHDLSRAIRSEENLGTIPKDGQSNIPMQITRDTDIRSLLSTVIERFTRLSNDSIYMANAPDMAIPRYVHAIVGLSSHMCSMSANEVPGTLLQNGNGNDVALTIQTGLLPSSPLQLLNLTDTLWSNKNQSLTATTYASILIAEYDISQLAVKALPNSHLDSSKGAQDSYILGSPGSLQPVDDATRTLRARYSRWLVQVCGLLRFHSEGRITVEARILGDLLQVMRAAARTRILNPLHSISTHHPQDIHLELVKVRFVVPLNGDKSFSIQSGDLERGPLASLVSMLTNQPGIEEGSSVKTCLSILRTYSAFAPVILQQILKLSKPQDMFLNFDVGRQISTASPSMFGVRFICVRLMLLTTRYIATSEICESRHLQFCQAVLDLVFQCMNVDYKHRKWSASYQALAEWADDLTPLLELASHSESALEMFPTPLIDQLVILVDIYYAGYAGSHVKLLAPASFPSLIFIIGRANTMIDRIDNLLRAMIQRMRSQGHAHTPEGWPVPWPEVLAVEYLVEFTGSSKGFSALAYASLNAKYEQVVLAAAIDITHLAANKDPLLPLSGIKLDSCAVPGFLDIVDIVADYCRNIKEFDQALCEFTDDALDLMYAAYPYGNSQTLLLERIVSCQNLHSAVRAADNNLVTQKLLLRLEDFMSHVGVAVVGNTNVNSGDPGINRKFQGVLKKPANGFMTRILSENT